LNAADPQFHKYSITFMFGCQQILSGLFITQLADGIMGMSAHPATLPKKLFDEKKIPRNQFAMCFRRELGTSKRGVSAGSMTLGGYKTSLDTSQMVFAKNIVNIGWFTVYVKNIYVRPNGGLTAKSNDPLHHATIRVKASLKALNSGKGYVRNQPGLAWNEFFPLTLLSSKQSDRGQRHNRYVSKQGRGQGVCPSLAQSDGTKVFAQSHDVDTGSTAPFAHHSHPVPGLFVGRRSVGGSIRSKHGLRGQLRSHITQ
jgi:hypothetical protein